MRNNFCSILWILLACSVIGTLTFNMPIAEAQEVTMSMSSIVIPLNETRIMPLSIGGTWTNDDLIDGIQITIEYDNGVAKVENTEIGLPGDSNAGIIVNFSDFGLNVMKWASDAETTTDITNPQLPTEKYPILRGVPEQLIIVLYNSTTDDDSSLRVPVGGLPAELLTIKFTAVGTDPLWGTEAVFINAEHTQVVKRDSTTLPVTLTDGDNGDIRLPVKLSALGAIWHLDGNKIFWEAESQQGHYMDLRHHF